MVPRVAAMGMGRAHVEAVRPGHRPLARLVRAWPRAAAPVPGFLRRRLRPGGPLFGRVDTAYSSASVGGVSRIAADLETGCRFATPLRRIRGWSRLLDA